MENRRELVAANQGIQAAARILSNPFAAAKGKFEDGVSIDDMAEVEFGVCIPVVLADRVENKRGTAISKVGLESRSIIQTDLGYGSASFILNPIMLHAVSAPYCELKNRVGSPLPNRSESMSPCKSVQ